jgi:hypothetical protein
VGRVPQDERDEVDQAGVIQVDGDLGRGGHVEAAGGELIRGQPHADGDPGAGGGPHGVQDLERDTKPGRQGSVVLITAAVAQRG